MKDFYDFAKENPILTFLLAGMILGTIVKLIPWSKKDPDED